MVYLMEDIKLSYSAKLQGAFSAAYLVSILTEISHTNISEEQIQTWLGRAAWDEEDKDPHRAGLEPTHALLGEAGWCCSCRGEAHSWSEPLCLTCCLRPYSYREDGEKTWSLAEPFCPPKERPQADQQKQVFVSSSKTSCGTLCLMSPQCRLHK